jgi:hypothetical protein
MNEPGTGRTRKELFLYIFHRMIRPIVVGSAGGYLLGLLVKRLPPAAGMWVLIGLTVAVMLWLEHSRRKMKRMWEDAARHMTEIERLAQLGPH